MIGLLGFVRYPVMIMRMYSSKKFCLRFGIGCCSLIFRYVVQSKTRPPTFVFFVNDKHLFKGNIIKFIRNSLIKEFGLTGVAIKVIIKERHQFKFVGINKINQSRAERMK
jgi:hypothetical protein